jgi:hypothetical protein
MATDLRGIRRLSGGFVSDGRILCHRCGIRDMCADFAATECREFAPILKFKPPLLGFEGDFNTFRLGPAWHSRVAVGDTVALMNAKTGEIFMRAKVTAVHLGDKREMAELYGKDGHRLKAQGITENVGEAMLKRLKNAYGTRAFNNAAQATVIYLRAIESL